MDFSHYRHFTASVYTYNIKLMSVYSLKFIIREREISLIQKILKRLPIISIIMLCILQYQYVIIMFFQLRISPLRTTQNIWRFFLPPFVLIFLSFLLWSSRPSWSDILFCFPLGQLDQFQVAFGFVGYQLISLMSLFPLLSATSFQSVFRHLFFAALNFFLHFTQFST